MPRYAVLLGTGSATPAAGADRARGAAKADQGQYRTAMADYDRALQLDPVPGT